MIRQMRYALLLLPALSVSALAQETATLEVPAAPVARIGDPALHDALESARKDLVISRTEFKRCAKVEQIVLEDAREVVYRKTPMGQAMPVTLAATADLLEAAAAKAEGAVARLCRDMAASYRAMALELDPDEARLGETLRARKPAERSADTLARAKEALMAPGGDPHPDAEDSWSMVKRGDPQFRALARNRKALEGAWATLDATLGDGGKADVCCEKIADGCCAPAKAPLAQAKELVARLDPVFADVKTERPPADPPKIPT